MAKSNVADKYMKTLKTYSEDKFFIPSWVKWLKNKQNKYNNIITCFKHKGLINIMHVESGPSTERLLYIYTK